jgi:hypothetical protein
MYISHTKKFIFIKPMKVGGTSIISILRKHCDPSLIRHGDKKFSHPMYKINPHDHETFSEVQLELPNYVEKYFVFSLVRNPWERLVSQFFYLHKTNSYRGIQRYKKFDKHAVNFIAHPFTDFGSDIPRRYMSFYDHLKNIEGKIDLNFVGKIENLQEDFNIVCDEIGIPQQQLPHKNKSKHKHYTEYYDDETREIVAEKYAKDIEYFGYKFGE